MPCLSWWQARHLLLRIFRGGSLGSLASGAREELKNALCLPDQLLACLVVAEGVRRASSVWYKRRTPLGVPPTVMAGHVSQHILLQDFPHCLQNDLFSSTRQDSPVHGTTAVPCLILWILHRRLQCSRTQATRFLWCWAIFGHNAFRQRDTFKGPLRNALYFDYSAPEKPLSGSIHHSPPSPAASTKASGLFARHHLT